MTFTEEVNTGALVFCNHSGGKDSQAMYLHLREVVPTDQLIIIHADLGDLVEWGGVKDHIRANIDGRKLEIAHAYYRMAATKTCLATFASVACGPVTPAASAQVTSSEIPSPGRFAGS